MQSMKKLIVIIGVLISLVSYGQQNRLALVIGNGEYEYAGTLRNPVNDALSMKKAFVLVGFEVLDYYNLTQSEMKRAIDNFGMSLKDYDVGLFFYAGHGIQLKGLNYLIPVDANLLSEQYIEYDCVQADRILGLMDASQVDVNIIILDACRNNPFERSWTRSSEGRGLAHMDAPAGTLIAYATAPGRTASDGSGVNGLYTEAILESMKIQDINIIQFFQNVRALVSQRSNKQQIPWESTSLTGDFYLNNNIEAIKQINSKSKGNINKTADPSDVRIAYFNLDSVMAKWDLFSLYRQELIHKQIDNETDLNKRTKIFNQRVKDFQNKVQQGLMIRTEAAELEAQLLKESQNLQKLQKRYSLELLETEQVMNRKLLSMIEQYVAELSEIRGYSFVHTYKSGGNLIYGTKAYDITDDVIAGLNKRYKQEKERE